MSCGCYTRKTPIDYVPKNSFLLFIRKLSNHGQAIALYKCVCGKTKKIPVSRAISGLTKSCGCKSNHLRNVGAGYHGLSSTRLYRIWAGMIGRCYNKNNKSYCRYGERGVKVCKSWKNSFVLFYKWAIENGYKDTLQLDKDIKQFKSGKESFLYSPKNCSFVTPTENYNCKRNNIYLKYKNKSQTITEWARELSIKPYIIRSRLMRGWNTKKTLLTPIKIISQRKNEI